MRFLAAVLMFAFAAGAAAEGGMRNVQSKHDVATTADRLEAVLRDKGMKVFTRIDHAAGAREAGFELPPTVLVIFGNPKVGTPLMLCSRSIAIDLPQKALIWRDAEDKVWLTYNDPGYLAKRHATGECNGVIKKVGGALANFAKAATN